MGEETCESRRSEGGSEQFGRFLFGGLTFTALYDIIIK